MTTSQVCDPKTPFGFPGENEKHLGALKSVLASKNQNQNKKKEDENSIHIITPMEVVEDGSKVQPSSL